MNTVFGITLFFLAIINIISNFFIDFLLQFISDVCYNMDK